MSLWRNVRTETAGAWRSLCYDLGRRPEARGGAGPDVTSTGMNTFPGSLVDLPAEPVGDGGRPPRRFVVVAAFCALAVCGAAGSYLVATTAFAGRMTDAPVAPPAVAAPPAPPRFEPPAATTRGGSAGMGGTPRRPRAAPPAPPSPAPTTTTQVVVQPPPTREKTRPATPVTGSPDCDCDTPPVPTPTAPDPSAPVSASPSGPAGPSPSVPVEPSFDLGAWTPRSDGYHRRHPW
jgi:hypothetical protein